MATPRTDAEETGSVEADVIMVTTTATLPTKGHNYMKSLVRFTAVISGVISMAIPGRVIRGSTRRFIEGYWAGTILTISPGLLSLARAITNSQLQMVLSRNSFVKPTTGKAVERRSSNSSRHSSRNNSINFSTNECASYDLSNGTVCTSVILSFQKKFN